MKNFLTIIVFILAALGVHISAANNTPLEIKGVLVYHNPSLPRFIEVIQFSQNSTKNLFDGELVTLSGQQQTYKLSGVIEKIDYPSAVNKLTLEVAQGNIKKLHTLLAEYPKEQAKFQPALSAWETALQTLEKESKTENQPTQAGTPIQVSANAVTIVTTTGAKYTNITISRADPDGLVVVTESGIEKIPFDVLPKEIQDKYGYDPQKAASYNKALQEATAKRQAANNAYLQKTQQEALGREQEEAQQKERLARAVRVQGGVIQVVDEGLLVEAADYAPRGPAGGISSIGGGGGGRNAPSTPNPNEVGRPQKITGLILLVGHPDQKTLVDNSGVDVNAYEDGIFKYVTTQGAEKTIKKYHVLQVFGK